MCCDTVNIEILDYCDITGVTVEEEKCAINISVEECFGASGTITDQDNIPRVINISINESDLTELNIQQSISDKINSLPLFVVSETDIVYYVITNRYSTTTEEGSFQNLLKYLYVTQGKGKGNYGYSSLNPILPSNLKLLATSRATLDDILNDGATQFIDLGNVGITDIVSAFNNHLFVGSESPVQDPNDDGYVIIDVIINGNPLQYLFVGEGGNYGTSGTDIAVLDNFVLLTDIQGLQSTQFIDLGEIGDTLIEDAVNSQSPCLTFQDPNDDGYVVVNTLNDGVLQQYLFVGIGGLYGDGCGVSVPLDFTAFTPPQEGFQYDDLWHVLGSGSTDSGIRATQYNQKIIHGGDIHATQFYADGGASGGFRNRGYGSTYITGNTGVVIRSSNPNNGIVRITSAAQINSEGNNSSKATVFIGRLFNNLIELANALYRGVVIDDTVDFLKKTDSTYIAQHTKPIILNRGLNKIYSWLSEIGDVEIRNGLLKLVSYGTGNSITGTPISNLGVDSQGNVIPTPLGGGGGVGFPRQNKVITFYLDDLGVTDFDDVTDEMVATYIAGLAIEENEEFDYVYELLESEPISYNFDVTADWDLVLGGDQNVFPVTDENSFNQFLTAFGHTNIVITDFSLVQGRLTCNLSSDGQGLLLTPSIREVNSIGDINGLTVLVLVENSQLTDFNPSLALPNSLEEIDLSNNNLTDFNPTLALPNSLSTIHLDSNNLTDFNPDLALPNGLTVLYLNNNQLTGFNLDLALPSGLTVLYLNNNQLTDFNPDLALPSGLQALQLSDNQLIDFNPNLALPISLKNLSLEDNQLNLASYTRAEEWANAQPNFSSTCIIGSNGNTDSITGTNLESILITKNATIIA